MVWWTCVCGMKVKGILDMDKAGAVVECRNPSCKARRTLPGQVTSLSVETDQYVWRGVDLNWLAYPDQQNG
jgi:hypothetical protein